MSFEFCYSPLSLMAWLIKDSSLPQSCLSILQQPSEFPQVNGTDYIQYFVTTCALEAPIYALIFAFSGRLKNFKMNSLNPLFRALLFCNLATHPIVCFGIPGILEKTGGSYGLGLLIGEIFAPLTEAFILCKFFRIHPRSAILGSIFANLFSWWSGIYLLSLS